MDPQIGADSARQRFFISYAHADANSVALRTYLTEELENLGHKVFSDVSIEGSQEWIEELTHHAEECDCFVVLISEEALASKWVRAEVNHVCNRYEKERKPAIFVVRLSNKEFDIWGDGQLGGIQALHWTAPAHSANVRDAILGRISVAAAEAKIQKAAEARKRWKRIVVSLAVGLPLAALVAFFFVLAPLRNIQKLRSALPALESATGNVISLSQAKIYRDLGRRPGWSSRADTAYERFLRLWSDAHLANARKWMKQGEASKGFVLAALVAQENGGKLDDFFSKAYEVGHYASLKQTLRTGAPLHPGLAVSADGTEIAAGNALWNVNVLPGTRCSLQSDAINVVAFGRLGLYTGGDEEFVQWTGCRRGPQTTVMGVRDQNRVLDDDLEDRVQHLAVSQDDTIAIVMHKGSTVRLQKDGAQFPFPLKHDAPVGSVAFSDDGSYLVTTSGETLNVWNRNLWNRPSSDALKINAKLPLRGASLNGDYVAVNAMNKVKIWRLRPNVQFVREVAMPWAVRSVALSRDVSDRAILLAMVSEEGVFTDRVARNAAQNFADDALSNIGARQAAATDVIFYDRNRELIVKRTDAVEIWDAYTSLHEGSPEGRLERWMNKFALTVDENGRFEARLLPEVH